MASTDTAVKIVDSADVPEDGPLVKVESVEKVSLISYLIGSKKNEDDEEEVKSRHSKHEHSKHEHSKHGSHSEENEHESGSHDSHKEVVHDGEGIKSTYDVEEDVPPSLFEQFKRTIHWNGR
ncbi:unnamed protein product [Calypogeia fissa]